MNVAKIVVLANGLCILISKSKLMYEKGQLSTSHLAHHPQDVYIQ